MVSVLNTISRLTLSHGGSCVDSRWKSRPPGARTAVCGIQLVAITILQQRELSVPATRQRLRPESCVHGTGFLSVVSQP